MSDVINAKIRKNLAEKVLTIAKQKFPLRNVDNYTEAIREALIEFVKSNQIQKQDELLENSTLSVEKL